MEMTKKLAEDLNPTTTKKGKNWVTTDPVHGVLRTSKRDYRFVAVHSNPVNFNTGGRGSGQDPRLSIKSHLTFHSRLDLCKADRYSKGDVLLRIIDLAATTPTPTEPTTPVKCNTMDATTGRITNQDGVVLAATVKNHLGQYHWVSSVFGRRGSKNYLTKSLALRAAARTLGLTIHKKIFVILTPPPATPDPTTQTITVEETTPTPAPRKIWPDKDAAALVIRTMLDAHATLQRTDAKPGELLAEAIRLADCADILRGVDDAIDQWKMVENYTENTIQDVEKEWPGLLREVMDAMAEPPPPPPAPDHQAPTVDVTTDPTLRSVETMDPVKVGDTVNGWLVLAIHPPRRRDYDHLKDDGVRGLDGTVRVVRMDAQDQGEHFVHPHEIGMDWDWTFPVLPGFDCIHFNTGLDFSLDGERVTAVKIPHHGVLVVSHTNGTARLFPHLAMTIQDVVNYYHDPRATTAPIGPFVRLVRDRVESKVFQYGLVFPIGTATRSIISWDDLRGVPVLVNIKDLQEVRKGDKVALYGNEWTVAGYRPPCSRDDLGAVRIYSPHDTGDMEEPVDYTVPASALGLIFAGRGQV